MNNKFIGIVLAGGLSRRFGTPKAIAEKNGKAFYKYSIDAIAPIVSELFIVANPKLEYLFENGTTEVIQDAEKYQGQGPLAGIYTAMEKYPANWYMVAPIDVPFIEKWVFERLSRYIQKGVHAIIPEVAGKKQPLIAIYHYSIKEQIEKCLAIGEKSVHKLLQKCTIKYVPFDEEEPFININRLTDYQYYIDDRND